MKYALITTALLVNAAAYASNEIKDRWYVSAFGGYTHLSSNINTHYYGFLLSDVNYRKGYNAGGSVGYQSDLFRYEFQYTYLYAENNRYDVDHITLLNIDGGTKANMLMGNIYYDFPEMWGAISPFLGVGAGYTLMHATLNSTSRFERPHFNASQNSFMYQGIAGLTHNFSDDFAMNAVYHYATTTNDGNWGKSLQAQLVDLGLVYRL
jgi:opacity protein-like surface antigen